MVKRVVIAGCRDYNNYSEAREFIEQCICDIKKEHTVVIVSGCCRGADELGLQYAAENGFNTEKYPADWENLGRSAGPIRNRQMAEVGDIIICFWDGESRGTKSMINYAKKLNKTVFIKNI